MYSFMWSKMVYFLKDDARNLKGGGQEDNSWPTFLSSVDICLQFIRQVPRKRNSQKLDISFLGNYKPPEKTKVPYYAYYTYYVIKNITLWIFIVNLNLIQYGEWHVYIETAHVEILYLKRKRVGEKKQSLENKTNTNFLKKRKNSVRRN